MVTALLAVGGAAALGAALWGWVEVARLRRAVAERDRQVAQWQALMGDGAARLAGEPVARRARPSRGLPTPAMPPDAGDPLGDLLRVVRDAIGAHEVTWWRRTTDGALVPQASSETLVPAAADAAAPHAAWADTEGLVSVVALEDAALVVGPVPALAGAETRGALVARGPRDWPADRTDAKRRIERYGGAVARVALLVESQKAAAEYSTSIRQTLEATRSYSTARDPERLAELVCESTVALYGMQRAAVVRWDAGRARGRVVAASIGHDAGIGQTVGPLSAVGEACTDMRPVLWQDVATARRGQPIFDDGEPVWKTGALLAVPLLRDRAVLGALVVESDRSGAIREHPLRMISLLAELVTPSLEALWNYEDVERRARTDVLTGLWNRRHVEAELARWLQQVDRYGGELGVVLVDVDHFKRVNDTWGHEIGDRVLQHVAGLLRDGARNVDVVGRLGGEEFVLLLPSTGAAGAGEVAERLRTALVAAPVRLPDGAMLGATASFGVAAYPQPVTQRDKLLAAADNALYAAKRDGRNCVRVATA